MKVCSVPGCPNVQQESRCAEHKRQQERARGSREARGYDAAHRAERTRWEPLVATGNVKCWRCGEYIAAGAPWDLGHDDRDRSKYRGPEHITCNRATASRRSGRGARVGHPHARSRTVTTAGEANSAVYGFRAF